MMNIMNPPADWSTLKKLIWLRGTPINGGEELTVSGTPPLSLPNSLGKPLKAWAVDLLPYQEGTGDPAPDNVRPIHGTDKLTITTAGKNLWNKDDPTANNGYYNLDGSFNYNPAWRAITFSCQQGFTYTKSGDGWGGIVTFWYNDTFVSSTNAVTATVPSGVNNVRFACQYSSTNAQLEFGSTASDYTPYVAPSQTVLTLPQTVYTGTIGSEGGESGGILETFNRIASDGGIASHLNYLNTNSVSTVGAFTRISFGIRSDVDQSLYNRISSSYDVKMCNMAKHYFSYASESTHWYRNTGLYVYLPTSLVGDTYESVNNYLISIKDTTPLTLFVPYNTDVQFPLTVPTIPTPTGTATTWATAEDGIVDTMEVTYIGKA